MATNATLTKLSDRFAKLSSEDIQRSVLNQGLIFGAERPLLEETRATCADNCVAIARLCSLKSLVYSHYQCKGGVEQQHYGNFVTIEYRTTDRYCPGNDWSTAGSWRDRKRRFSVNILPMDQHGESGSKRAPLLERDCKNITIRDPLLQLSAPNPSSSAIWFEDSACEISEQYFCEITEPSEWFNDQIITTGFAILDRVLSCKQQRISLCDPWSANGLYKYYYEREDVPLTDHKIIDKCKDMDFVVVPVSDGFFKMREQGEASEARQKLENDLRAEGTAEEIIAEILQSDEDGKAESDTMGTHWSVMVIDCRGKTLKSVHLDSWHGIGMESNIRVARDITKGLLKFMSHDQPDRYSKANMTRDPNVPKQHIDNACTKDSQGACGPFVWAIAKDVAQYIIECREDAERQKRDIPVDIALPVGFKTRWQWDSAQTRRSIRNLIERERRVRTRFNKTHAWWDDQLTGKDGWKTTLNSCGMPEDWFWDPYQVTSGFEMDGSWRRNIVANASVVS